MAAITCKPFNQTFNVGDKLICPVCGEEFTATEHTCFALTSGFVCSWRCFVNKVNECESKRRADNEKASPWVKIQLPKEEQTKQIVVENNLKQIVEEPVKRKRGRPRKNVLF